MPSQAPRDAAVIDIGSNSVRLVVYRLEGRAIWTVFNEKVLAGLGRDLAKTGRLSPDGVIQTLQALKRFRAVLEAVNPAETFVVATAAARDAQDGPDFIARVKAEAGFTVRVLTGEEEAHYAAVGVLAGAPDATGVVGDLGGASLELIRLSSTGAGKGVTLPLGPFSLASASGGPNGSLGGGLSGGFDGERVRRLTRERIAAVAADFRTDTFHAVGGAWRNLALLHMRLSGYPLHVVHQYEIPAAEAVEAARLVSHQSKSSLERIEGMSKKRSETLPYAAVVLEILIEQLGLKRIEISAFGVREGLLFEAMPPRVRGLDPLVEGCTALGARQGISDDLGPALETWIAPAFRALAPLFGERDETLISAACRLSDVGARLHPDHRADLVFEQVLRAPIAGQSHAERCFLAVAAHARHATNFNPPELATLERLLSPAQLKRARALGATIRLACDLSGRSPSLLAHSRLTLDKNHLTLAAEPGFADLLLGEQTSKRANTAAQHLGLKPKIITG
ncbi:Ppx/GppA phosphatase family protein [Caulobacter sp. RL271]|jgi:exopolyphosphatase/guanosine-5'-triphosphate,3'-diphosphate pyrophosphatase|uniref:Ppx/GppA family phosphatase n=1 Tax=Caulobacter segnis TaxID=88688 RepID=A0ABY4ZPE0_9CAUL|nr:Ppx/GppA phosphatase family protein [Caulobacter segnis]USQ93816.1 Ppx/GppA family phosphatase [Caulobacter segnis]